jgi:hypothetical protein
MTLDRIMFTVQGCHVDIDGVRCELGDKLAILRAGGCILIPLDHDDRAAVRDFNSDLVGSDKDSWECYACTDPRVVMLALRWGEWCGSDDNAPWPETAQAVPSLDEAMQFVGTWLAQSLPQ